MGAVKKGIYTTVKVTSDSTSILCGKEGQKETNGAELLVLERVDDKKQLLSPTNIRCIREHRYKEGIHKDRSVVGVQ